MKKKRTISVRHPQLVGFRNSLREIISLAECVEYGRLLDEENGLDHIYSETDGKRVKELLDKQSKLDAAMDKSICVCSLCGSRTSNMTFNTSSEGWFCVKCYEKAREFYKRKAREGEIWYGEDFYKTPSTEWWP